MTPEELDETGKSIVGRSTMPRLAGEVPEPEVVDCAVKLDEVEAKDELEVLGTRIGRMQDGRLPLREAQRLVTNE